MTTPTTQRLTLTLFGSWTDPNGRELPAAEPTREDDFDDFGELAAAIADLIEAEAPTKTGLFSIGPYRLRPGTRRGNANVEAVTLVALDVDRCDLSALESALDVLDIPALVYGSPSDDPDGPTDRRRVRVLVQPSREIRPDECARVRVALANAVGLRPDCGVMEALDPARLFFCGRVEGTPPRYFRAWGVA